MKLISSVCFALALLTLPISAGWGQTGSVSARPPSEELLPESTTVYVQVRSVPEFVQYINQSNLGKALAHEKIAPLAEQLWGSVKDQYEKVRDDVGVSLEDLQTLLTGEVCFAVVNFDDRSPGVVVMIDYDSEAETLDTLISRGEELIVAEEEAEVLEPIQEADVEISVMQTDGPTIHHFRHDGTFVASTDLELLKQMLARWRGEQFENERTLAENRKFITIMNRCRGTKDAPPDARAFIDPIELLRGVTRGDIGAQLVINLLPTLGLDGLLGIGGSVIAQEEGYESISHLHVLMSNPRRGILEMIALRPGDCTPEPWVPDDATTYLTGNLKFDQFYEQLREIVDMIQGEGTLDEAIESNINANLEINLQEDVLAAINGRMTFVQWIERPIRFNSQCTAVAIELKDPETFTPVLEQIFDKALAMRQDARRRAIEAQRRAIEAQQRAGGEPQEGEPSEEEAPEFRDDYRGIAVWTIPTGGRRNRNRVRVEINGNDPVQEALDDEEIDLREQTPNFAVIDNFLVFADSRTFIEKAIDTYKGDYPPLAENENYLTVTRHMQRLLGTSAPAGALYSRPDLALGMWYEMAQSEQAKKLLDENSEDNDFVGSIRTALEDNPLPDFEELRQFFPPNGGFITSDETGIHLMSFEIRSDDNR